MRAHASPARVARQLRRGTDMALIDADSMQDSYDVIVVGSGAAGGQTAYTLTHGGREGADARGGPQLRPGDRDADVPDTPARRRCAAAARPTSRSASTTRRSTAAGRCPASPTRARPTIRRAEVLVVACAHARRAHQSLGPHLAAQRAVRLQAAQRATGSASTGRSPTRTSRRTTTRSRC